MTYSFQIYLGQVRYESNFLIASIIQEHNRLAGKVSAKIHDKVFGRLNPAIVLENFVNDA